MPVNRKTINLNIPIHSLCIILKFVASSVAEAELDVLFLNGKQARGILITLAELINLQPPNLIYIDNTTNI